MNSLLLIALAPVAILLAYIWLRDKYEKEPWQLLLKALALGAISVIPVLFVERFLMGFIDLFSGYLRAFWNAFVVAAFTEELFKFIFLYLLIWKSRDFNEKFDGIVYAVFISLGFAGVENVMYVLNYGHGVGITRALTAVPAHFLFGVSMGYFFGMARFYADRRPAMIRMALLVPMLLHGIYDFILMSQQQLLLLLFIPFVIWMWRFGLKKMRELSDSSVFRFDYNSKDPLKHN
ncbi:PrsW family glutamic-type intramembrane protease [Mangrovibacterium diazotrophicum]|uniref:Protease PrsW n=1 Tax=Mangrovibacterium diazotrophicum TaxID=1261403 RepID=A0A419WBA4_9BACT|nr:PrsW family glutamic-type intramembrane protease [Mangrovibacterium diazotrophicum]RKD92692.1 RsiW-degrading membrane proteinase PrsW (M82 family) [Mangrovibacterium diazotrophicum]